MWIDIKLQSHVLELCFQKSIKKNIVADPKTCLMLEKSCKLLAKILRISMGASQR